MGPYGVMAKDGGTAAVPTSIVAGALLPLLLLPHTAGRGAEQKKEKKKRLFKYNIYILLTETV